MAVVHGWGASARCPSAHDHQHTKRSLAETVINNEVIFLVGYEWSTHFSKKKKNCSIELSAMQYHIAFGKRSEIGEDATGCIVLSDSINTIICVL